MSQAVQALQSNIPKGVGLGLRAELWDDILAHPDQIDCIELVIDDYLDWSPREAARLLKPVLDLYPSRVVAHGVRLSIASAQGIDETYVERVARLLDALKIEVYTEHLSFRRAGHEELGQFVPVPFTETWASLVVQNIRDVQRITSRTIALENISYLLGHHAYGLGEGPFLYNVLEEADCALLLDVTNLLINAANLGYTPSSILPHLPLHRLAYTHLAGGHTSEHFHIDSHGHPLQETDVLLLERLCAHAPTLQTAFLERDKNYPPFSELLGELQSIRKALTHGHAHPNPSLPLPHIGPVTAIPNISPPAQETYDVNHKPQHFQHDLTHALTHLDTCKTLASTPVNSPPSHTPHAWLHSFGPHRLRAFTKILGFKRREKFDTLLPGIFRHLNQDLSPRLHAYFHHNPDPSLSRVEDGVSFATFIAQHPDSPPLLQDLALHERTLLELHAAPWSLWRWFKQRRTITLRWDPKDLDTLAHQDEPLPQKLNTPTRVRYIRKRRGVWMEILGPNVS